MKSIDNSKCNFEKYQQITQKNNFVSIFLKLLADAMV